MKLSEILIDGAPAGFSYFIDGVKVIMVAPRHRGIDVFTISSKKYCFEDQSIEAGEVVGGLGLAAFWIYDKEGSGCTLRVVVERTVTVDELVAAKRVSPTVPVEDVNQGKPTTSLQPTPTSTETNLTKEKAMSSTQKETNVKSPIQELKDHVSQYGRITLYTMLEFTKSSGGLVTLAGMFCNFKQNGVLFEFRVPAFQEMVTTFEDQSIKLKAYQCPRSGYCYSASIKTTNGCIREIRFLSIGSNNSIELDEIIASLNTAELNKPSDQTELVQQLQKRLNELEKTVADLKKESADVVKSFKFSDLLEHFSSTTGYRIYLGDNEINRYYNTPVTGIVLYDGKRLVAEFDNQDLTPLEYPSTGLMSYNVLATDGKYYNLRVTGYQAANEEEFFSK